MSIRRAPRRRTGQPAPGREDPFNNYLLDAIKARDQQSAAAAQPDSDSPDAADQALTDAQVLGLPEPEAAVLSQPVKGSTRRRPVLGEQRYGSPADPDCLDATNEAFIPLIYPNPAKQLHISREQFLASCEFVQKSGVVDLLARAGLHYRGEITFESLLIAVRLAQNAQLSHDCHSYNQILRCMLDETSRNDLGLLPFTLVSGIPTKKEQKRYWNGYKRVQRPYQRLISMLNPDVVGVGRRILKEDIARLQLERDADPQAAQDRHDALELLRQIQTLIIQTPLQDAPDDIVAEFATAQMSLDETFILSNSRLSGRDHDPLSSSDPFAHYYYGDPLQWGWGLSVLSLSNTWGPVARKLPPLVVGGVVHRSEGSDPKAAAALTADWRLARRPVEAPDADRTLMTIHTDGGYGQTRFERRGTLLEQTTFYNFYLQPNQARPVRLPGGLIFALGAFFAPRTDLKILERFRALPADANANEAVEYNRDQRYIEARKLPHNSVTARQGKLVVQLMLPNEGSVDCRTLFKGRKTITVDLLNPFGEPEGTPTTSQGDPDQRVARFWLGGKINGSPEHMDVLKHGRAVIEGAHGVAKSPFGQALGVRHSARGIVSMTIVSAFAIAGVNETYLRSLALRRQGQTGLARVKDERQRAYSFWLRHRRAA